MSRRSRLFTRALDSLLATLLLLATAPPTSARTPSFQIIVHAANPATGISRPTASKMFLGRVTRWPAGVPITPYDLAPDASVRVGFTAEVHRKRISAIQSFWQRMLFNSRGAPPELLRPSAVIAAVRLTPGAIAYVAAGEPLPPGVKRLPIAERDQLSGSAGDALADVWEATARAAARSSDRRESTPAEPAVPEGALLALAVSPAAPDTVWASFQDRGLWASADGGQTWAPAPASPEPALGALAFDLVDSQLLLAGGEKGLYRSLDLGHRWHKAAGDAPSGLRGIRGLATLPQSPGTFFAHSRDALWRSDDFGASFAELPTPGPVRAVTVDAATGDLWLATGRSIRLSRDRGESWTKSADFSGRLPSRRILVADLAGTKVLWVAAGRGLLRAELDDEGLAGPLQPSLELAVQRLDAFDETIFAATEQGVYELAADGRTWELLSTLPDAVLAIDPLGTGRAYAGNPEGRIWRREHPAAGWRQVFHIWDPHTPAAVVGAQAEPRPPPPVPLRLRCAPERGHVGALAVHPNVRGVLWAASEHGVFRSDDGGASWGPPGSGLVITDVHSLAVDPKTPTTLWAGTHGGGVYVSRDGGASWAAALGAAEAGIQGRRSVAVHEVAVDPSVPDQLYAATPGGVAASHDGGAHWHGLTALSERGQQLSAEDPAWRIAPRALAVDPDSLHPMTLTDERGRLFDVDAVSAIRQARPGRVRLPRKRFGGGVCAPAGRRNARLPRAHLGPELTLRDLTFADDPEGSMVPWAATAFGVWRAAPDDDSDAAWTRLPLDTNVAAVAVDQRRPERVYAAAVDGLWRSGDAGLTWERWGLDDAVFSLAVDPGPSELVYAGLSGGRIAIVRARSSEPEPGVTTVAVPPRLQGRVDRRRLRGISSVLHLHRDAPPEDHGMAFWRAAVTTPHTASRLRALYAAEGLSRVGGEVHEDVRSFLIGTLQRLRRDALAHGNEMPAAVALSPGGRWLLSEWRFDDGLRSHSELRLYAPGEQGWQPAPRSPSAPPDEAPWMRLHDLAAEPPHLRPAWLLEDPGPRLAWSGSRSLLATHGGPDRILVWALPEGAPAEMARLPAPRVVHLRRGQDPRGARGALADSGRWLAVAQHTADRHDRTAVLSLLRLDSSAEQRTLDVLTRPRSDPSPYFTRLVITGDERYLLGFREDGSGQVWPLDLEGDIESETLPEDRFKAIYRGPHGSWLATVVGDRHSSELQLRPLRGPGHFEPISLAAGSAISRVSFRDDESWLSAVVDGRHARLWDLRRRPSPQQESPEVALAATASDACAALFDARGDWLTHGRGASKIWLLREPDADGRRVRSRRPSPRSVAGGGTCSGLPETAESAGALALERRTARQVLSLWNLSGPELRHRSAQVRRFGPAALHRDEGALRAPDHLLDIWPKRPLNELSDGALRSLTCQLVGRPPSREEWSFALGAAEYRPLCPPLPKPSGSPAARRPG